MIYTLTLNPALDYVIAPTEIRLGALNRTDGAFYYGGKGINVSVVLTRLGIENRALGFLAGFTGREIEARLRDEGVACDFLYLANGNTRLNVKIRGEKETELNGAGAPVSKADIERLLKQLDTLQSGDFLVLSGSVPPGVGADIYAVIMRRLQGKGVRFAVDAAGELLENALAYQPFLIKPNHLELGALFGVHAEDEETIFACAEQLQARGAQNVLVSSGEKGAVLLGADGKRHSVGIVKGKVINTVGCGDSMVAGFLAGWLPNGDDENALRLGAACGNAAAFCEGLADKESITELFTK